MRSGRDSIRDLGGGRYRVAITVGYDPETGRQVRLDRTIRCTKRDLPFEIERLHRECGTVSALSYGSMSVADFVADVWLEPRRKKLQPSTLAGYDATIKNHVRPAFSRLAMRDVTALHITPLLARMEHQGAALNVFKMLNAAFELAAKAGVLANNPMAMVPRPELDDYRAEVYSIAEVRQVLEVFRGSVIEPGVLIMATCGTRMSETCALDWHEDIDLDAGELTIRDGYQRVKGERILGETKTEKSRRVIAIPPFAVARLVEICGDGRIGPMMVDATGQRMTPDGFTSRWRRKLLPRTSKAGETLYEAPMRYIPPMCLRHSHTTNLLDLGVPMRKVSLRDGHTRESTTADFYDRHKAAPDHDVAAVMDKAMTGEVVEIATRANSR